MRTEVAGGVALLYDPGEDEAAGLIAAACERSLTLLGETWGLHAPRDLRIYVMTSWRRFLFDSAPWAWRLLLALTAPVWCARVRTLWAYAGGWAQRYGRRSAVGVKPPRLIEASNRSLGERIFIPDDDGRRKVQHITCHELTHACTAHLGLPTWLNEGLAMVAVDRYFGQPTVRPETLAVVEQRAGSAGRRGRERIRVRDEEATVYQYTRGYWLARYLEDTRPGLLKRLLARPRRRDELEREIAAAYGQEPGAFWGAVESKAVSHFQEA